MIFVTGDDSKGAAKSRQDSKDVSEPGSQGKKQTKSYENVAFVGSQVIDSQTSEKERESGKHEVPRKEVTTMPTTKSDTTAGNISQTETSVKDDSAVKIDKKRSIPGVEEESLSISDEDLREMEDEESSLEERLGIKSASPSGVRPELKSSSSLEKKRKSLDDENNGNREELERMKKLHSAQEETIAWEETQETKSSPKRPVMFERISTAESSSITEEADSPAISESDSSMSVGKAKVMAHGIIAKVIEEAKVLSAQSSPEHVTLRGSKDDPYTSSKSREKVSSTAASRKDVPEETILLAREIVDNVIAEVQRKLSSLEESETIQLSSSPKQRDRKDDEDDDRDAAGPSGMSRPSTSGNQDKRLSSGSSSSKIPAGDVKVSSSGSSSKRASGDGQASDREKESSSDAPYFSCASSSSFGRSPSSRPTSGELDINIFASPLAPGSGRGGTSSEYETCVSSQGSSSTIYASALEGTSTSSYATARSSLSSAQSSRGSTLEPDSEPESSGHLGEISASEASETIVQGDDRDLATPTIQELEEDDYDGDHHALLNLSSGITEPYDLPIPEDVIRAGGLEGHSFRPTMSSSRDPSSSMMTKHALMMEQQGFFFEEEPEGSNSEASEGKTWHSSSVRTAVSGSDVVKEQESGKETGNGQTSSDSRMPKKSQSSADSEQSSSTAASSVIQQQQSNQGSQVQSPQEESTASSIDPGKGGSFPSQSSVR